MKIILLAILFFTTTYGQDNSFGSLGDDSDSGDIQGNDNNSDDIQGNDSDSDDILEGKGSAFAGKGSATGEASGKGSATGKGSGFYHHPNDEYNCKGLAFWACKVDVQDHCWEIVEAAYPPPEGKNDDDGNSEGLEVDGEGFFLWVDEGEGKEGEGDGTGGDGQGNSEGNNEDLQADGEGGEGKGGEGDGEGDGEESDGEGEGGEGDGEGGEGKGEGEGGEGDGEGGEGDGEGGDGKGEGEGGEGDDVDGTSSSGRGGRHNLLRRCIHDNYKFFSTKCQDAITGDWNEMKAVQDITSEMKSTDLFCMLNPGPCRRHNHTGKGKGKGKGKDKPVEGWSCVPVKRTDENNQIDYFGAYAYEYYSGDYDYDYNYQEPKESGGNDEESAGVFVPVAQKTPFNRSGIFYCLLVMFIIIGCGCSLFVYSRYQKQRKKKGLLQLADNVELSTPIPSDGQDVPEKSLISSFRSLKKSVQSTGKTNASAYVALEV